MEYKKIVRNYTIKPGQFNDFIADFMKYHKKYVTNIKDIVTAVQNVVMVDGKWTSLEGGQAYKFAEWFNPQKGESDGCDLLMRCLRELEDLYKVTCFLPCQDLSWILWDGPGTENGKYPCIGKLSGCMNIFSMRLFRGV